MPDLVVDGSVARRPRRHRLTRDQLEARDGLSAGREQLSQAAGPEVEHHVVDRASVRVSRLLHRREVQPEEPDPATGSDGAG